MSRKTGAVPARKKSKMRTSNWQFWAIIALPVIYAIVFAYIPMGGIVIAFKDYSIRKGIFGSDWVGLKYFKQFLTSTSSVTVIKNTVILGIYTLVVNFPIPILLAIGINEIRNKTYKKTIQMITYAPYFISVVVLVGMMMQMMDLRSGVINMILQKLGMNPMRGRCMDSVVVRWPCEPMACIVFTDFDVLSVDRCKGSVYRELACLRRS